MKGSRDSKSRAPLVSYIIVTRNKKEDLRNALRSVKSQKYRKKELIVVDNNSSDSTSQMVTQFFPDTKLIVMKTNVGPCRGRNIGIKYSRGEIIIIIDHDAVFVTPDATDVIVRRICSQNDIGAIALKVINFYTKKVDIKSIPRRDKKVIDEEYECTYFSACGVAIRKDVLDVTGGFPEEFFYYGEELDLSFRIIQAGYKILHLPEASILHKTHPKVRPIWQSTYYTVRNRTWVAFKYLPLQYAIIHSFIWWNYCFIMSLKLGFMKYYFKGCLDAVKGLPSVIKQRKVLSLNTIKCLKKLSGRLYY